jgi:hypothetical protein
MVRIVAASFLWTFIAASLSAQVPVYTNKPIAKTAPPRHQITPEEYQSLLAHQFVYVPPTDPQRESKGPTVAIANYTPPVALQTPLPAPSWLAEPIYMMPYTGWGRGSYGHSYGYSGKPSHRSEPSVRREPQVRPRETRHQPAPASTPAAPRQTPRPMGIKIQE